MTRLHGGPTPVTIASTTLERFTTFGDLLRFLRRRIGISQVELSLAVGYSNAQISRLEQNLRPPDLPTIEARFVPALGLEDEPKAVARLLELAASVRREDAPVAGSCPYKGLNYFDEADADLFVGREALTGKLADRLLALCADGKSDVSRFLAIVGASGSGKSSLVRAGLVPVVRWGQGTAGWPIHVLTPGVHPIESLAISLVGDGGSVAETSALIDDLMRDPRNLHLVVVRTLKAAPSPHLLIVIDQFEELFSLCRSEAERTAFVDSLLAASSDPGGPTAVIVTLRADFYSHCAAYARLRNALARHQEYIGSMSDDELRRAIEEPAHRGHWELEPGLVDLLVHDVGHEPGALPLLSHALLETWERRRGRSLTLGGYASAGGVRGAIAETAEAVFTDQFTPEQRQIARRLFLRLTELGDEAGAGDTRRRASFDELILKPSHADATRTVLKALADARLITLSQDAAEVAHEALIREWPTLRGWLEENREALRLQRQLSEAAQEWSALQREPDVLFRGARLTQLQEWAAANSDEMNALELEFLNASVGAAEQEAAEREARRQQELEAARKLAESESRRADEQLHASNRLRARNRIISAVGLAALILAVLAGIFNLQASRNLSEARANFAQAESLRLAAQANILLAQGGDPQAAALLSIRALQADFSMPADAALSASLNQLYNRQIFRGHTGAVYSVAFSPDGKLVLTASQDGTARLWDIATGNELRRFAGHKGGLAAAAFSPDGRYIVTGGNDQTIRLWDAASGAQLRLLSGHAAGVSSVAFSPDGRYVLSASGDTTAELWDAASGQPVRTFSGHAGLVSQAVFSPDGHYVLTGSYDDTVRLWDVATADMVQTFSPPASGFFNPRITSVAYSPDGRYIVAGSTDQTATLWDAASGGLICTFTGHTASVDAVAFSPDGSQVITAGNDRTARVWSTSACREVRRYAGFADGIRSVAFSPDGQGVLIGGEDGSVELLAAPGAAPLRTFAPRSSGPRMLGFTPGCDCRVVETTGGIDSVAFSPDGHIVLTAGEDHIARLWDRATGAELRDLIGHTDRINVAAFSPDGRYVATAGDDKSIRLWDAQTGSQLRLMTASFAVYGLAFSPDGKSILTTSLSSYASTSASSPAAGYRASLLWETATGRELRAFNYGPSMEYGDFSSFTAFSPDGARAIVVATLVDGVVFDVATGDAICLLQPSSPGYAADFPTSVAFSRDGRYVLTGSDDKTARLWDVATCHEIRIFTDKSSTVNSVAFSPDGKYVLTGHDDDKARLWDLVTGALLREFTGHTRWIKSVAFSPDGKYVLTGSIDGTARLWDVDYHDTIRFACSLLWRDLTPQERAQYNISDSLPTCAQP